MFFRRERALALLDDIQARVLAGGSAIVNVLVEGTTYMQMTCDVPRGAPGGEAHGDVEDAQPRAGPRWARGADVCEPPWLKGTTMHATPTCFDCKIEAPETNTDYTLIGAQGWRLARRRLDDGTVSFEWRCSECWAKYKEGLGQQTGLAQRSAVPPDEAAARSSPHSDRTPPADSARPSERGPVPSSGRSGPSNAAPASSRQGPPSAPASSQRAPPPDSKKRWS